MAFLFDVVLSTFTNLRYTVSILTALARQQTGCSNSSAFSENKGRDSQMGWRYLQDPLVRIMFGGQGLLVVVPTVVTSAVVDSVSGSEVVADGVSTTP